MRLSAECAGHNRNNLSWLLTDGEKSLRGYTEGGLSLQQAHAHLDFVPCQGKDACADSRECDEFQHRLLSQKTG